MIALIKRVMLHGGGLERLRRLKTIIKEAFRGLVA